MRRGFFSGFSGFPPSKKINTSKLLINSIWKQWTKSQFVETPLQISISQVLPSFAFSHVIVGYKMEKQSVCNSYILSIVFQCPLATMQLALIFRVNSASLLRCCALERLGTSANRERSWREEKRQAPSLPALHGHFSERSLAWRQELDCFSAIFCVQKTRAIVSLWALVIYQFR